MYPVNLIVTQCPVQGHYGHVEQIGCSLDGDKVRHDSLLLIGCGSVYLVILTHAKQISKAIVKQIAVSVTKVIRLTLQKREQLIYCQPYQASGDDASEDDSHLISPL